MITSKIKELLEIVHQLQEEYKTYEKKFTLDGRLVGDLGEVLAMEKYKIQLYNKVEKKYDGYTECGNKKVQIKATMKDSVWYPRDTDPELFLAIEIGVDGSISELYNGESTPIRKYIKKNRTRNPNYNYYTITKGVLKRLNKEVIENSRIEER